MAHAIWKGSIRFGLVTIPVGLYSAESPDDLDLDLIDRDTHAPIGYKRINKTTGKAVAPAEVIKGFAVAKGKYVPVSDKELKAASPEATRAVDIVGFVEAAELSPLLYDKPYYLAPEKSGAKAYALLRTALADAGRVGIARVVVRTRQYVAAMYPHDRVLVLHLLRYAHELRDTDGLGLPAAKAGVTAKEMQMAKRLIEDMDLRWNAKDYHDDYRDELLKLIKAKAKAGDAFELETPEKPDEPKAEIVDLMAQLKESLASGAGGRGRATARRRQATETGRRAARAPRRRIAKSRRAS